MEWPSVFNTKTCNEQGPDLRSKMRRHSVVCKPFERKNEQNKNINLR